jgi:toxin-antitoxin system PIN domain toxin
MRIAIDTNVLVAATMDGSTGHATARALMGRVRSGNGDWCLAWSNVYEFLRVTTHSGVFPKPLAWSAALDRVDLLLASPGVEIIAETSRHRAVLREVVDAAGGASGNFLHDCHLAALMVEHDVTNIVTGDTGFRRFARFRVWSVDDALKRPELQTL